jgi:hypothetical protein
MKKILLIWIVVIRLCNDQDGRTIRSQYSERTSDQPTGIDNTDHWSHPRYTPEPYHSPPAYI